MFPMTPSAPAPLAVLLLALASCGGEPTAADEAADDGATPEPAPEQSYDVALPTVRYTWDPEAGDPSVPAELGGPGFTGEGWETNLEFRQVADPEALRGGEMARYLADWPATLSRS